MKFNNFIQIYQEKPFIDSSTFSLYAKPKDLRRQVRGWIQKGYLLALKKGLYIFNQEYKKIELSKLFVANFLVVPSYISLEYALGLYGLIPERVKVITSVTTKKTKGFKNCLGVFEYRSVKEELFFGFKKDSENNQAFFIATPEKAIIDYFYFNNRLKGKDFSEFESLRLQNIQILNKNILTAYAVKCNKRVIKIINTFMRFQQHLDQTYKKL